MIGPQDGTDFAEQSPSKPRYDEFTAKNSKRLRKRTGATGWTQKICKALERYLRGMQEVPDDGYGPAHPALEMQVQLGSELAEDICGAVVLDCDDPGRRALKSADKEKRKKEKKRKDKMESAGSRKGKRRSRTHDSGSSTDGSSSIVLLQRLWVFVAGASEAIFRLSVCVSELVPSEASNGDCGWEGAFPRENH